MYYRSGTAGRCCIMCRADARGAEHSSEGGTFARNDVRPPSWNCDVKSKIQLRQSVHIYLKNNPAKFHPDPIWNDRDILGFLTTVVTPNNKMSSDVRNEMSSWSKNTVNTSKYSIRLNKYHKQTWRVETKHESNKVQVGLAYVTNSSDAKVTSFLTKPHGKSCGTGIASGIQR